jgi:hypothetical protein
MPAPEHPPEYEAPFVPNRPYSFGATAGDFQRVTRSSVTASYVESTPKSPIPDTLIPDSQYVPGKGMAALEMLDRTDTSFDRDTLITSGPIPEVNPAFAGLRARIAQTRAERTQAMIETLAKEQAQLRYIGESVIRNKGYLSPGDKDRPAHVDRPHNSLVKGPGARLARIEKRRQNVRRAAYAHAASYPEVSGKKRRIPGKFFYDEYDKGPGDHDMLSWGERRAMGVAARKYRNNERMSRLYYDKLFRHVVTGPTRSAKGLPEKRDKLTLRSEALRLQAEETKQRREERKTRNTDRRADRRTKRAEKRARVSDKARRLLSRKHDD